MPVVMPVPVASAVERHSTATRYITDWYWLLPEVRSKITPILNGRADHVVQIGLLMKFNKLLLLVVAFTMQTCRVEADIMYVLSNFQNAVYRYDAATAQPLPPSGNWPGLFVGSDAGLHDPHGLALGPDGDVYVGSGSQFSDFGNGVFRFDKSTGALVRKIGVQTAKFPFGIAFGPDGMLYVNSYNTQTIQRYNPDSGAFLGDFVATNGSATSIAFGPDGHLYVANSYSVERFDGKLGTSMGRFTSGHALQGVYSLTFGPDGDLYLLDQYNYDIDRFDGRTGVFKSVFVDGQYLFNPSSGMAFGRDGNLYTTNFFNGNTPWNDGIDRYDGRTGASLGRFMVPPDRGYFTSAGIAFDPPAVIPEPNSLVLIAIGLSAFSVRRRFGTTTEIIEG